MTRCYPLALVSRRRLLAVLLFVTFLAAPAAVLAQSATATLSGTVTDPNNAVVPGARVTATNTGTGLKREATTSGSGTFTIPLLPPSTYTVLIENQGFTPAEIKDVTVNVGDNVALNIQLKVGQVGATVDVKSDASLINESPAVGTVVDRQFAANIPLNGRSFQSLITLAPGVVLTPQANGGQFSVNGQRASANSFIVDGVSGNFGASPNTLPNAQTSGNLTGLTTSGTTQTLVSVDALQELRVQTSTYTAEYGRQPGGQISIITRSGTNDFHGSAFDYVRNDVFDANDWFANKAGQSRPPERQNDFGGTFSGPVLLPRFGEGGHQPGYNGRNKTFFFFSYEGLRLRLPKFALTNVPTLMLRQTGPAGMQPILNAFPLPNGRDLGNGMAEFTAVYSDPSNLNAASIRIDHAVSGRLTLFGRYNRAPSESLTRGSNLSAVTSNKLRTQTITLGATASLNSHAQNEFKINYSDNAALARVFLDSFGGATPANKSVVIPSQYDSRSANGQVLFAFTGLTASSPNVLIYSGDFNSSQRQLNIVDNFSYGAGKHELRFGVDYRRLTPIFAFNSYSLLAIFRSATQVLNSTAASGFVLVQSEAHPVYVNLSLYGQDTWKLSRRITVNLGLRWEVNPAPREATGNDPLAVTSINNISTMQLAPRGTKLWRTTYNNFAPRVGIAYQLSQKQGHETVVRGGFGVYYDTGNDQASIAFAGFPFQTNRFIPNITFPLSATQVAPPPLPTVTPQFGFMTIFDPALKLPYTLQWNLAAERSLGKSQVVTVSYVGAAGRRLLQQTQTFTAPINPSFLAVNLTRNKATSDYDALQVEYQRRLSRGLQALGSYTWSHAIDEDSFSNNTITAQRGNAAFDVRHNFAAAVTYNIPTPSMARALEVVLSHWSIDSSVRARSPLPVDLIANSVFNPVSGGLDPVRPNVIAGVPFYLYGSQYPGGKILNNTVPTTAQGAAAGCAPLTATNAKGAFCTPTAGQFGNLGRNVVRALPAWQVDSALSRQFKLTEKVNLQFRAEAFNIFNHPNFGTIQTFLGASNFGQATNMLNRQLGGVNQLYQLGGPRSFQFALKLLF